MGAAAVLLAGAVVVADRGAPRLELDRARTLDRAAASPSAAKASPTPTASPTPSSRPAPPAEDEAGPGTTNPGVAMRVAVRSDGSLEVAEQALFERERATLALAPPDVAGAGSGLDSVVPVVRDLQVVADGRPVEAPDRLRRTVVVDLGGPTRMVELRYVLDGTTRRSLPSDVGRGLGVVAPISTVAMDAEVMLRTGDESVLNLLCPRLARDARVCASGDEGSLELRAPLTAANAVVVLQVSMPRP